MEMTFTLPGGARVDAHIGPYVVPTDQPPGGMAPSPFMLFLASIGACAAYYVSTFCQQRGIATDGVRLVQHTEPGPAGLVRSIRLGIELPEHFPQRYREAVVRAAEQCTVKKHLEHPPSITVRAVSRATEGQVFRP